MEEIIWFSMPGAVLAAAVVTVWPTTIDTEPKAIMWVIFIPAIGFAVHQLYRLIFEVTGGYARKSRLVVQHINKEFMSADKTDRKNDDKAFLIWEITFYSNGFPSAFRDHDRGAWHYILSFWSISFSSFISFLVCIVGFVFVSHTAATLIIGMAEMIACVIFWLKGRSTYKSLVEQEVAIFYTNKGLFFETFKGLCRE